MVKAEDPNDGGTDFELSPEEMARLSPEEQEIMRQQAEIMKAEAAERAEDLANDAGQADAPDEAGRDESGKDDAGAGLQEAIARQKTEIDKDDAPGGEVADDGGGVPASQGAGQTLQDIIAKQKANLRADLAAKDESAAPDGEHTADGDAGDAEAAAGGDESPAAEGAGAAPGRKGRLGRLSMMHVLLMMNGVIVLMVIGVFLSMSNRPQKVVASVSAMSELPSPVEEPQVIDSNVEIEAGLTWQMAEGAYRQGDYLTALAQFRHLLQTSRMSEEWMLFGDFFRLRTAQCLVELGQVAAAQGEVAGVLASRSPVLRAVANYRAGVVDLKAGRFMRARTRGYLALGALGAMKGQVTLVQDVEFLIARALTEKALAFHPLNVMILWSDEWSDPLEGLDDVELTAMLTDGMSRQGGASLGAVVERVEDGAIGSRWSVMCTGSKLEGLLQRSAAASQAKIRWESVDPRARRRAVTMSAWAVSPNRLAEIACGSTGLVARFTGEEIIVWDPFSGDSLQQQRDLIVREGMSAWRRLFLRHPGDKRLAAGHYALASLCECSGDLAGAMREHLINYRRFPRDPIAPESLLRSAKLRIQLLDYTGARNDLLELLNSYPDTNAIEETYQALGDATAEAGLWDEAIHAYSKLYFLGLSDASRAAASFGAGKCHFAKGAYEEADKWLGWHIQMADKSSTGRLAEAYYLLGRTKHAMGSMEEAAAAYYCALSAGPSDELRPDIVLAAAGLEADRDQLVKVAGMLESLDVRELTGDQAFEYLLLYSRVHRAMGITERALTFLESNEDIVTDVHQRARVTVERARCYAELNELKTAKQLLTCALLDMSPGPDAQVTALELAEACLMAGDVEGAIALADKVARLETSDAIHRRARNVLGGAYLMNQNYNEAAQVLSGLSLRYNTGGRDDGSNR